MPLFSIAIAAAKLLPPGAAQQSATVSPGAAPRAAAQSALASSCTNQSPRSIPSAMPAKPAHTTVSPQISETLPPSISAAFFASSRRVFTWTQIFSRFSKAAKIFSAAADPYQSSNMAQRGWGSEYITLAFSANVLKFGCGIFLSFLIKVRRTPFTNPPLRRPARLTDSETAAWSGTLSI